MCKYCNEPYRNMSIIDGTQVAIKRNKYSPSGHILVSDNSAREYAKGESVVYFCPMCGRELLELQLVKGGLIAEKKIIGGIKALFGI